MPARTTTYMNTLPFVADAGSITRDNGRQIDWDQVPEKYRSTAFAVTTTGVVAAAAVSIPVVALPQAVKAGQLLYFGDPTESVRVTTAAAAGATSLAVDSVATQIESGDIAYVAGSGAKTIKSGTVMALLSTKKMVTRADRPGSETASGILETTAIEGERSAASTGYSQILGGVIYENELPEATGGPPKVINSTFKTELQTAGVGTGFAFLQYTDTRT
jgi:hypothetical protein